MYVYFVEVKRHTMGRIGFTSTKTHEKKYGNCVRASGAARTIVSGGQFFT